MYRAIVEKNTHLIGKILSDIANEQKREPFDLAADLVTDEPDLFGSHHQSPFC